MLEYSDDDSGDSVEEIDMPPIRSAPRPAVRNVVKPTPNPKSQTKPDIQRNETAEHKFFNQRPDVISPVSILSKSLESSGTLRLEGYAQDSGEKFPSVIQLNVGGVKYMTRLSTLKKYEDSMLAALFSGRYKVDKDADGNYFLDSNGYLFGYILEYLRNGLLPPKEQSIALYREASYYGIHELVEKLQIMPPVVALMVKEAHIQIFPDFREFKGKVIRKAMEKATFTKVGDVIIYAFKAEFSAKVSTFNPNHGCIVETADVKIGPWDAPVDEEVFMRCLETDLTDDGFILRPHEAKRKCRYYHGQSCQKFVYRLQITF